MKKYNDYTEQELKELTEKARIELDELGYKMVSKLTFYSNIMNRCEKVITYKKCPIAAVYWKGTTPILLVNPLRFNDFTQAERMFVLIHEILHLTSRHHKRGAGLNSKLWNIAADLEINQMIMSEGTKRPDGCLMPNMYNVPEGLTAEEYYKILNERGEDPDMPDEVKGTMMEEILKEQQEEQQESTTEQNSKNQDEQKNDHPGKNNRRKEGKPSENKTEEGEKIDKEGKQGKGGNPNGESSGDGGEETFKAGPSEKPNYENLHRAWEQSEQLSEDAVKGLLKELVREARSKSAGNVPGEMQGIISELEKPQVNWKSALRTFTSSVLSQDKRSTWNRPNRRTGNKQMGSLRKKKLNLMVAIDTSGSLSTDELRLFLSEINAIKKQTEAEITIVQCDAYIQSVQKWKDININHFQVNGGGGTDLCPPFELAAKRKWGSYKISEVPDGVIYLTDGYGPAPEKSSIRTMFVISPGGRVPYTRETGNDVTWGNSIELKID